MTRALFLFIAPLLLFIQHSSAQTVSDSSQHYVAQLPLYSNEFFLSAGYAHCRNNFFDAGIRYYHWRNDGQTIMAFAGAAAGCEFSLKQPEKTYITYIGWQGQLLGLGYGVRAEYGIRNDDHSFGCMPELGLSIVELLRLTAGYRFSFYHDEGFDVTGFHFSVVAGLPLSFLKEDEDE